MAADWDGGLMGSALRPVEFPPLTGLPDPASSVSSASAVPEALVASPPPQPLGAAVPGSPSGAGPGRNLGGRRLGRSVVLALVGLVLVIGTGTAMVRLLSRRGQE